LKNDCPNFFVYCQNIFSHPINDHSISTTNQTKGNFNFWDKCFLSLSKNILLMFRKKKFGRPKVAQLGLWPKG